MEIYINLEQLNSKADEISEIAAQLQENMSRIESLVINLGLEWQGKAEISYAAKILFVKKQFETLYQFFMDYTKTMKAIVNEYESIEKQIIKELNF